jgi:ribosome-associated toxin RatA of RatAB toxin-antitoxin module
MYALVKASLNTLRLINNGTNRYNNNLQLIPITSLSINLKDPTMFSPPITYGTLDYRLRIHIKFYVHSYTSQNLCNKTTGSVWLRYTTNSFQYINSFTFKYFNNVLDI